MYAWQHVQLTGTNRPRAWVSSTLMIVLAMKSSGLRRRRTTPELTTDFGGHGGGVTPVPIPNTEVKPSSADGTWDECPRESRTPPDFFLGGACTGSPRTCFGLALTIRGAAKTDARAEDMLPRPEPSPT